jgi:predicted membrane GTPase involved in stress response
MEALSHRRAEVMDMGPVPGNFGRTRLSLTCPSRLVLSCSFRTNLFLLAHQVLSSLKSLIYDGHQIGFFIFLFYKVIKFH